MCFHFQTILNSKLHTEVPSQLCIAFCSLKESLQAVSAMLRKLVLKSVQSCCTHILIRKDPTFQGKAYMFAMNGLWFSLYFCIWAALSLNSLLIWAHFSVKKLKDQACTQRWPHLV